MHTVRTVIVKDNNPRVLKCLKTLLYIHNSKCNSGHRVGSDIRGRFLLLIIIIISILMSTFQGMV